MYVQCTCCCIVAMCKMEIPCKCKIVTSHFMGGWYSSYFSRVEQKNRELPRNNWNFVSLCTDLYFHWYLIATVPWVSSLDSDTSLCLLFPNENAPKWRVLCSAQETHCLTVNLWGFHWNLSTSWSRPRVVLSLASLKQIKKRTLLRVLCNVSSFHHCTPFLRRLLADWCCWQSLDTARQSIYFFLSPQLQPKY